MSSQPPEPSQRLFFALWPDGGVRDAIDTVSRRAIRKRARRMPPEKLHITLAFAGQVSTSVRDCLAAGADGIRGEPFTLQLDTLGYWPRPRIIWFGPREAPAPTWSLVRALRGIFLECGLRPESRPWAPHITLARKAGRGLEETQAGPIEWSISDFCLVESVTDESGASYRILRRWPLEG